MYSKSRLSSLLEFIPWETFTELTEQFKTDRYTKKFDTRSHLISHIAGQLMGCRSLRELQTAYNSQSHEHYHLRSSDIKRSTLAEANQKRDAGVFESLCKVMLGTVHRKLRKQIKEQLYLLDSTSITLSGLGYDDWTLSNKTQRTQGIKCHILYASEAQAPVYAHVTAANVNDIEDAKRLIIENGATYVFDKGYYDYNWWWKITQSGAYFVSRFKYNAGLIDHQPYENGHKNSPNILCDETVRLKYKHLGHSRRLNQYQNPLRKVTVRREGKRPLVLVTNDFSKSADQIAELYKTRWEIELFFKWLKQNLKIKKFWGQSENAVRIQLFTALITYLLVHMFHQSQKMTMSLKLFVTLLSTSLFQRPETEYALAKRKRKKREQYSLLQGSLFT